MKGYIKVRRFVFWMVLLILVPIYSSGQEKFDLSKGLYQRPGVGLRAPEGSLSSLRGLFDPARFSMSHSYSVAFTSDGSSGSLKSLYLNTIDYRFSIPLSLKLQVGYLHSASGLLNRSGDYLNGGQIVILRMELKYQPKESITIRLQYGCFALRYRSFERLGHWADDIPFSE